MVTGPSLPTSALLPSQIRLTDVKQLTRNWQLGQLLQAVVVGQSQKAGVSLRIGNQVLQADSGPRLETGQRLTLQVTRTGEQPVLKVLDPAAAGREQVNQILKQALPRQAALPPLLANFSQINSTRTSGANTTGNLPPPSAGLPATIRQLVTLIVNQLPEARQTITPAAVRSAFANAGPFLEARLGAAINGQTAPAVESDLKTGLLRLLAVLQKHTGKESIKAAPRDNTPPPLPRQPPQAQARVPAQIETPPAGLKETEFLQQQVQGALARIETNQAALLTTQAATSGQTAQPGQPAQPAQPVTTAPTWLVEIPLRDGEHTDVLALEITQQEPEHESSEASDWTVTLALDLAELGPMHVHLKLRGEAISARFLAENEATVSRIRSRIDEFSDALASKGLSLERVDCQRGNPPPRHTGGGPLVDVQA